MILNNTFPYFPYEISKMIYFFTTPQFSVDLDLVESR